MYQKQVKISPNLPIGRLSSRKSTLYELILSKITNKTRKSRMVSIAPQWTANSVVEYNHPKFEDSRKLFCNHSTIDGLHLIGGSKKQMYRKITVTILFIAIVLSCYQCYDSLRLYKRKGIRTTISYQSNAEIPFPALTFCNVNTFKRSIASMNSIFLSMLNFIDSTSFEDVPILTKQNNATCHSDGFNQIQLDQIMTVFGEAVNTSDFMQFFQIALLTSDQMVKKCWWNNVEVNCSDQFVNHMLDWLLCFTFNQDSNILDSTNGLLPIYGMEGIKYVPKMVTNQQLGLKLLLDTYQNEYCGTPMERSGAGFRLLIHDTKTLSDLKIMPSILLSPGYEYTVILQPVAYDMRNFSESLHRCTSYVFTPWKPDSEYDQQSCFLVCLAEIIWKSCKCLMIKPNDDASQYLKELGQGETEPRACNLMSLDEMCMVSKLAEFESKSRAISCPKCIQKCFETKYEYTLTAKRLKIDNTTSSLYTQNYANKNLILVKFSFGSMDSVLIRETELFTLCDLLIYWGNTLGLFLGFSCLTMYEIFHYIINYCITILIHKYKTTFRSAMTVYRYKQKGKKKWKSHCSPISYSGKNSRNPSMMKDRKPSILFL